MALSSTQIGRAQEEAQPPADQPQAAADDAAAAADDNAAANNAVAPPQDIDKWNDPHSIPRLKSPAFFWPKLLVLWLLFVIWVKSADWVNRDSQIFDLSYGTWNPILYFPFVAVLLLVAFPYPILGLPMSFLVAAIVLPICYLATFVPYVYTSNKAV